MKNICKVFLVGLLSFSLLNLKAQSPSIGGFNVYYGHLHNHTSVSDGTGTPDQAYYYAKNTAKLDFFSLADHSSAIDATEWTAIKSAADYYNQDNVFTAFRGFEWTENVLGHVAVINSDNFITTASPYNTFAGLCSWLNSNECVAFFNHPGRNNSTGQEFAHFTTTPTDKIVGMELWNKTDRFPVYYYTDGYYSGDGNKSWYDEALLRGWKIGAEGSEDNHSGTWGTATTSRLAVLATANNRTTIYEALKARRFFTTYDSNLALSFKINGYEMGSTISATTSTVEIKASDANSESFTSVELLKNGAVLKSWTPNTTNVSLSETMTFSTGEYYYIRVKQADGDEAISSPIWIGTVNQWPTSNLTLPLQNTNYTAPASVTIAADASDADGAIQKVEFYQGSTLLGEDTSAPYSYTWNNVSAGSYSITAKAIDNLGAYTYSNAVAITVVNPGDPLSSSSAIAAGMDDVEESSTGNILSNVNSTDIELINDAGTSAGNQVVGLRFTNLNISKGAIISNAYIQFTCDEVTTGTCNLLISGEDTDNSAAFTTVAYNVSSRTKTTAQVGWNPSGWATIGEAGVNQRTPNLSAIIQEIVSRTSYLSSGAISFIITGSGTRTADSYEGSAAQAAKLFVTYTVSTVNQPPVVSVTSPLSGASYTAPASVVINANASDPEGNLAKVDFYQGTTLLGSDTSSPYSYTWSNVSAGSYTITAIATDNQGATARSAEVLITVATAPVTKALTTRINAGSDDAEETSKGVVTTNGDDIELCYDTKTTGSQVVGLRFNGIAIPQGATISKAYIQFTVDEKTNAGCTLTIKGEASDNVSTFTSAPKNISGRSVTSASIGWIPSGWPTVGQSGSAQQTPDLKAIVQEIVGRAGWSSGNSLAFVVTGTGNAKRTAVSYETSPAKAASLYIEYKEPAVAAAQLKVGEIRPEGVSQSRLICYPVPFTNVLNVEFAPKSNEQILFAEVYNVNGAMLKKLVSQGNNMLFELPDSPPGLYFIRVKTTSNVYQAKVVKQ
jgi:Predicted metal-dependent phosphoesterases (PHP family)